MLGNKDCLVQNHISSQQVNGYLLWQHPGSDFIVFRTNVTPPSTCSQFVGYSDEVLDVKFLGKDDSHIVVATNSCQLKVFELLTNSCQILYGHTGW